MVMPSLACYHPPALEQSRASLHPVPPSLSMLGGMLAWSSAHPSWYAWSSGTGASLGPYPATSLRPKHMGKSPSLLHQQTMPVCQLGTLSSPTANPPTQDLSTPMSSQACSDSHCQLPDSHKAMLAQAPRPCKPALEQEGAHASIAHCPVCPLLRLYCKSTLW